MSQNLITVPSWGMDLVSLEQDGHHWVAITPFCKALGIDERGQRRQIMADETYLGCTLTTTLKRHAPTFFLRWDRVIGWLSTINPNRVRLRARATLIRFRRECFDVLHAHFAGRNPSQPLLPYRQFTLSEQGRANFLAKSRSEREERVWHGGKRFGTLEAYRRAVQFAEF